MGKDMTGSDRPEQLLSQLETWLSGLPEQQPADWTQLPDIGLYMDQVVTYIDRQLSLHRRSDKEHVVTSAMVNNYIKDGLLPRADLKKYAPIHLAQLTMIGALKPVLSMQDLQTLLQHSKDGRSVPETYSRFLAGQQLAVTETAAEVIAQLQHYTGAASASEEPQNDVQPDAPTDKPQKAALSDLSPDALPNTQTLTGLRRLALDLAIEARVRILIAEQLLATVSEVERVEQAQKLALDAGDKSNRKRQKPQA